MKINSIRINFNNNNYQNKTICKLNFKARPQLCGDVFDLSANKNEEVLDNFTKRFVRFINKGGITSKKEYTSILTKHPFLIIEAKKYIANNKTKLKTTPEVIAKLAVNLKENLDKTYGKDNYTVIAIGTSPSSIGEVMQYLGTDISFIPVTNLRFFKQPGVRSALLPKYRFNNPQMNQFSHELAQIINKSQKENVILMDYVYSGQTMSNIRFLLDKNENVNLFRIKNFDLVKVIEACNSNVPAYRKLSDQELLNLKEDFYSNQFEDVSNVPHFDILNKSNPKRTKSNYITIGKFSSLQSKMKKYVNHYAKCFNLVACYEARKLAKKNPDINLDML